MFGTNIKSGPCNTNEYIEPRSDPTDGKISSRADMMSLNYEISNLNDDFDHKVVELIVVDTGLD